MGSVNIGFSIATSLCLSILFFFMGWLSIKYNWNIHILQWAVFPFIASGISFATNAAAQAMSCDSMNLSQLISLSLVIPGFILFSYILTFISFIRSPIESVVPPSSRLVYGPIFAKSFYVFWATMFGAAVSIGTSAACI